MESAPSKYEENSLEVAVPEPAGEFTPRQEVEAVYKGLNDKGNPKVGVVCHGKKPSVRWEGAVPDVSKGEKFQAIVKSYNPNATPQLTLCLKADEQSHLL